MIRSVLFDFDDTLGDYKWAQEKAKKIISVFLNQKTIDPAAFWDEFHQRNEKLFQQYTAEEISLSDYRSARFRFNGLNAEELQHINTLYMDWTNENVQLFNDAEPVLKILLKNKKEIAILTNGPSDGQRTKLKCLNMLSQDFKFFISSEIGLAKPSLSYFQYVLNHLNLSPDEALMIGDSMENDYFGAQKAGIHALLLDRKAHCARKDIPAIHSLYEILEYPGLELKI